MNYRRGFQRIYAMLTLAWIAILLLNLPSDRWDFWRKWDIFDQVAAHPCAVEGHCSEEELKFPWIAARVDQEARLREQPKWKTLSEYITLSVPVESRVARFLWLVDLLLLPPTLGYTAFFIMAPWIYRGFKSPRQRNVRVT